MTAATPRKAKPRKSTSKIKDLPPRKDVKGAGSVDKIALNHNEVLVADRAWIG